MTDLRTLPAFEARLAQVQCRETPDVEALERDGWRVASEPSPWGSVWMTRPAPDAEREP